jgi:hypothetical protein
MKIKPWNPFLTGRTKTNRSNPLNILSVSRKIPKKNLSYEQAKVRYPKLKPFGDADRDGIKNWMDCKPFDRTKHSAMLRADIKRRLKTDLFNKEVLKEIEKINQEKINEYYQKYGKNKDMIKDIVDKKINAHPQKIKTATAISKEAMRYLEKNPEMISEIEKYQTDKANPMKLTMFHPNTSKILTAPIKGKTKTYRYGRFQSGMKDESGKKTAYSATMLSPIVGKKSSTQKNLGHELTHARHYYEQPTDQIHTGEEYTKKMYRDETYLVDKEISSKEAKTKYEKNPEEIRTEEEMKLPTPRQLAKMAGPKPEALESFDEPQEYEPDRFKDIEEEYKGEVPEDLKFEDEEEEKK